MNLKKHNITNVQKSAAHEPGQAFLAVSDARIRRLVQSLAPHDASLVLTGEPGCGKSHLAQQAAHAFAAQSQQPMHQVLIQQLDELLRLCLISPETPASDASDRVLASLQAKFPEHELVIVALGIDNYHGDEAAFFEHLVRARQVRFIGTAQQVVGAADRLARDPGVNLLAVEPFTIDESDAFPHAYSESTASRDRPSRTGTRQPTATRMPSPHSQSPQIVEALFIAHGAWPGSLRERIGRPQTSWPNLMSSAHSNKTP